MPDSPENNFTTLNSTYGNLSVTLSEGNLKYTTGTSVNPVTGTISIPTTGKWYWEVYVSAVGDAMIGVQNRPDQQANGYSGRKTVYYRQGGSGGGVAQYTLKEVVMVDLKHLTQMEMWFQSSIMQMI